ncbi:MAG: hypothetical protein U9O24_01820 [Campylobacterota bacterium]|nr:hypothetical protein [Campylobacterota bacterium]
MQLNEILEEYSVKEISKKTNIAVSNVEILMENEFSRLKKVKTLGFISILEREFKVDLTEFKEEALEFYLNHPDEENSIAVHGSSIEEEGNSKLFLFFIIFLLGYASWYFFTQFDQKKLSGLLPFKEDKSIQIATEKEIEKEIKEEKALNIVNVISEIEVKRVLPVSSVIAQTNATVETNTTEMNTTVENNISSITNENNIS